MLDSTTMSRIHPPSPPAPANPARRRPPTVREVALLTVTLVPLLLAACGGIGEPPPEVVREELEVFLADYLPRLSEAYASQDASLLEGYAVPKELSKIEARTTELAAAGRYFAPELVELTVEDFSTWNYSNAFVSTFEVWDIRAYTLGTDILLQESLGQRNRVKYQLKRKDDGGGWQVLYRELGETIES